MQPGPPTRPPRATGDFETRSACSIKLGAHIYSLHPTTEVMVFRFRLPYWPAGRVGIWHPGYPHLDIPESSREELDELFRWIADGGLFEAHNAGFEKAIWRNICTPKMGWPPVPRDQWRCSAAKCAYHNLPRSLEGAGIALKLVVVKDVEGGKVMKKLCKPRKMKKAERESYLNAFERGAGPHPDDVILWHESWEEFEILWSYCGQDVLAEEAVSEELDDLPEQELRVWLMDQDMNERGVMVDREMVLGALRIASQYKDQLNRELFDITGIESGTLREPVRDWLNVHGVALPNTQGEVIDKFLRMQGLTPAQERVLTILREVNRTSTAKYDMALKQMDPRDDRCRDQLMYHGAGPGRWTGKGMQVHNFKKGFASNESMANARDIISSGDMRYLMTMYGPKVMEVLSHAIRGIIRAAPGRELCIADFSAIEARVVLWLARQMSAMAVFERGDDIYMDLASEIYGYPVTNKKTQNAERQFGKQAILGLGFEMGFVKFLQTCRKYNIQFTREMCARIVGDDWAHHEEKILKYFESVPSRRRKLEEETEQTVEELMPELILMRHTVIKYRTKYPEVTQMWRDQEAAAIAAARSPGRRVTVERGRNTWVYEGRFLKNILPDGKPLFYLEPKVLMKSVPWDKKEKRPSITFIGANSLSGKPERKEAYGGLLVENLTQATARELMAQAMVRGDETQGYDVIMSVHDELVSEVDEGVGDVHAFERMLSQVPSWAHGCPIDAEGWIGPRYRK
jgi:DNA polymerase